MMPCSLSSSQLGSCRRPQLPYPRQSIPLAPLQRNAARQQPGRAAAAGAPSRGAPVVMQAKTKQFASFDALISESDLPVLVQFHAQWCGPCLLMGNHVSEVSKSMKDNVKFVKVDTDKYHSIAQRYHIAALPTLVLFKGGKPVDRVEGVLGVTDLQNRLKYYLGIPA